MRVIVKLSPLVLALGLTACGSVFEQDYGDAAAPAPVRAVVTGGEPSEQFVLEAEAARPEARGESRWEQTTIEGVVAMRKVGGDFYPEARLGPGLHWEFAAESAGAFDVWVLARTNADGDSLFFEWDGEASEHHWALEAHGQWVWAKVRTVKLVAGQSTALSLWAREDAIEVDRLQVQTAGAREPALP